MHKGAQHEDHIGNKAPIMNGASKMELNSSMQRARMPYMMEMHPNNGSIKMPDSDPAAASLYSHQKQMDYMEPRCRYEQFQITPEIREKISECQSWAKTSPDSLAENGSPLLVYWPEDKVWYYWAIKRYNSYEDKFDLLYDDGVQETVHLWEEDFMTLKCNMKSVEDVIIDGFTIKAKEYYPSDDDSSFISWEGSEEDEGKIVQERHSKMIKQNPVLNVASTSQPGANSVENFSTGLQGAGSSKNYFNNTFTKDRKGDYLEAQTPTHPPFKEAPNIVCFKNGPFDSTKITNSKNPDSERNKAMRIEKEEWDQLYKSKMFSDLFGSNYQGLFDSTRHNNGIDVTKANERGYPSTRSAANAVNNIKTQWMTAWRQKHLLPSSQRLRRDMKAYEKKFYERYLSSGYKLCECPTCETLELKFMIFNDRDPLDYKYLHEQYLQKKINKDSIVRKDGIYQNNTIIFLNKAGI